MESLCDNDVTSSSSINLKLFGPIVDINYKNPPLKYCLHFYGRIYGSFENEALENEDRSTKHPKLENEAP